MNMSLFLRQTWTLTVKNLLVILVRPFVTTTIRALILPVIFIAFISYARNLFVQPATYGIGTPTPLRSFSDALDLVTGGRDRLVFVHNDLLGGAIEQVIETVAEPARANQDDVQIVSSEAEMRELCRTSLRGVSKCIAGVVFFSSPNEGPGGSWNYSIRTDAVLGAGINVNSQENDQEVYLLPLQHSIEWTIAQTNSSISQSGVSQEILEYPFTSLTQKGRQDQIRTRYMGAIIDVVGVAIFIGIVGVTYQLTGLIAMERELGMSQLIDCMMPNSSPWVSQAARFCAAHLALDIVYAPGWIIMGAILKYGVYQESSTGIIMVYNVLAGLALSSFSVFGASFFKKAQLSGISVVISCLLLGVIAQMVPAETNGPVIVLSLLFPSMNFVYFSIFTARWEREGLPVDLSKAAPNNPWDVQGITLWILLIIQIIVYPILAGVVERLLYGTASKSRNSLKSDDSIALSLSRFTKIYKPGWFYRNVGQWFGSSRQSVLAVNNLTMEVTKGQIMVLLGANGSGKSTTLDAIAGLTRVSSGRISINYSKGGPQFGLCPQKNVLWDTLTVKEHVKIFNRLKSIGRVESDHRIVRLVEACDLGKKVNAYTKTLSGGQKRKVQLAMMFTGGSSVCCVDEVSSGLDPISRRKIWDILLAERGSRTILLTTHFLDEADLLADQIAILSKGVLKAQGSTVELKNQLGSGYRIHVLNVPGSEPVSGPQFNDVHREVHFDETVYTVQDSAEAARFVSTLEQAGVTDYRVSGPTIEDVFLKVAEELDSTSSQEHISERDLEDVERNSDRQSLNLLPGKRLGMFTQAWYLFRKRLTILRRNPLPYAAAVLTPIIAAGLVTLFLKGVPKPGCSGDQTFKTPDNMLSDLWSEFKLVVGPSDRVETDILDLFVSSMNRFVEGSSSSGTTSQHTSNSHFHMVDSLSEFTTYIENNFANVTPGGIYLGDSAAPPAFAWKGDNSNLPLAGITQNVLNRLLTGMSITFTFNFFDIPTVPNAFDTLQLIVYFGLAMSVYPALFALYPTVERLRNVRALHFSNGVRSLSLWLAYLSFDFCIVVLGSVVAIVVFRAVSNIWYHAEYLFAVIFLYGMCATLCSYLISLFAKSQLAAFAFAAGGQCVLFLIYFIAYMSILTYAPADKIDSYVELAHFTIGIVAPSGNLLRALFVSLNMFSILCRDQHIASYPGEITLYGGPIAYLTIQSIALFALLVWLDGGSSNSGSAFYFFQRGKSKNRDLEEKDALDSDIAEEIARVSNPDSKDGLRVLHVNKTFKKFVAVEDITFGVGKGEVFALLGPNGAGKTTTISLIRGDMAPTRNKGEIFIDNISVLNQRAAARSHLGVCPQFDAMDQMTVLEHLIFYARIRGIPDIAHNVQEIIRAVGLSSFQHRMATKLSGGNKRKLSLGIALMGNPSVLLLDEPSSGMDAASKRVMWKTLAAVVDGRSIVLTTHSMEEADALAHRAGIMARRMLALGTTNSLRAKYGNMYHIHLIHAQAPHTTKEDMERIRDWVMASFPGAIIEQKTYHGQLRFSVPASLRWHSPNPDPDPNSDPSTFDMQMQQEKNLLLQSSTSEEENSGITTPISISVSGSGYSGSKSNVTGTNVSKLFSRLEQNKSLLGVEHYSVSQTTLDQVFLTIVGRHDVEEENSS